MKYLYRVCAGIVLTIVFALSTFAGQIPCGGIADPLPPPQTAAATTEDNSDSSAGIVEALATLLQGVLPGF